MSFAEIKKSINSDLNTPLDKLIKTLLLGGYAWSIETGEHILPIASGINKIYISAIAAGGGGGGAASTYVGRAGGGGGGAGASLVDNAISANTSLTFTMGSYGTGGAGIVPSSAQSAPSGGNGGNLVIGTSITLNGGTGGGGGWYNPPAASARGGTGGTIGGGTGGAVNNNTQQVAYGGPGGSDSTFGTSFGNGGNGGTGQPNSGLAASQNGGSGIIIITWGALRFTDVWNDILLAIAGGATHGGSEE